VKRNQHEGKQGIAIDQAEIQGVWPGITLGWSNAASVVLADSHRTEVRILMKTFEERMRAIAAGLPATARMFVPGALIDLLIDLCKAADKANQERSNEAKH
jgi:hypothetical protein